MMTTTVIAIGIAFFTWLIRANNVFLNFVSEIEKHQSNVAGADNARRRVYSDAVRASGKLSNNEVNALKKLDINSLDHLNADTKWDVKYSNEKYDQAYSALRSAITAYNKVIMRFPNVIAATILGYQRMPLPDEEKMAVVASATVDGDEVNDKKYL